MPQNVSVSPVSVWLSCALTSGSCKKEQQMLKWTNSSWVRRTCNAKYIIAYPCHPLSASFFLSRHDTIIHCFPLQLHTLHISYGSRQVLVPRIRVCRASDWTQMCMSFCVADLFFSHSANSKPAEESAHGDETRRIRIINDERVLRNAFCIWIVWRGLRMYSSFRLHNECWRRA